MDHQMIDEVRQRKRQMRAEALARRARQPNAETLSRAIFQRLVELPEYVRAETLMLYLDIGDEVRTRWFVPVAWKAAKRVVVPYCEGGEIELFQLGDLDELAPGMMDVLEPKPELRGRTDRRVDPSELDMVVVPGLAFDRQGGRLGYGKGYYDKLLPRIRSDAKKVGVCFECQMVSESPRLAHDIGMDMILTENRAVLIR